MLLKKLISTFGVKQLSDKYQGIRLICLKSHFYFMLFGIVLAFFAHSVTAQSSDIPNDVPCIEFDNGSTIGDCPNDQPFQITGLASGTISAGNTTLFQTLPEPPVCQRVPGAGFEPSPCFARIDQPTILGCAFFDLRFLDLGPEESFRTGSCGSFLRFGEDQNPRPSELFTLQRDDGGRCSGAGNFSTFVYGGPTNGTGAEWMFVGPTRQRCEITYNGVRPTNLLGPTWLMIRVSAGIGTAEDQRRPRNTSSDIVFVPIDGDIIDFIRTDFEVDIFGLRATFTDETVSNVSGLRYEWDFGDGNTSNAINPRHTFDEPGSYLVRLTVTNANGDVSSSTSQAIEVSSGLVVDVSGPSSIENGEEQVYQVSIGNFNDTTVSNFSIEVSDSENILTQVGIAQPSVLAIITPNKVVNSAFTLRAEEVGETTLTFASQGNIENGEPISEENTIAVAVQPSLNLDLSAQSVAASDEEITISLRITNEEQDTVEGIRVESLLTLPNELVDFVSGPLDSSGINRNTNFIDLESQESIEVFWTYTARGRGIVEVEASVAFDSISDQGRAIQTANTSFAIDTAALAFTELRITPEKIIPGEYVNIRGTITNIGNFDVEDISFEIEEETPNFVVLDEVIESFESNISPNIEFLAAGESQEFLIPVGLTLSVDDETRYTLPLRFTGTAIIDPQDRSLDLELEVERQLRGDLDRTDFYIDIIDETLALITNGFISIINEFEAVGEQTLLGGIAVGSAEGVVNVLQSIGDGFFTAGDLIEATVDSRGENLTQFGTQFVNMVAEYRANNSLEQILIDVAELEEAVTIGAVDTFAQWMFDVENAARAGNSREVARLITEPTATVVLSGGGEIAAQQLGSRLFARLLQTRGARSVLFRLRKSVDVPEPTASQARLARYIDNLEATFDDIPAGVPLTARAALAAGIEGDDLAFMIDTARRQGVTFFVRPRPARSALWSRMGFNPKPLAIKTKSVNNIDIEWLGYNAADEGLIVFREPVDPTDALRRAIAEGRFGSIEDFDPGNPEIQAILRRYSAKRTDWETRNEFLAEKNSVKEHTIRRRFDRNNPDADGTETVREAGIVVRRGGEEMITTVSIDPATGRLIYDSNGNPIYSDIDLLAVSRGDGTNISATLHEQILKESGFGFDGQHHATAQTSDFPSAKVARNVANEFMNAHRLGGEPLLIIGPEVTTKGYVKTFTLASDDEIDFYDLVGLTDYELFGRIVTNVSYIGTLSR